MLQFSVDKGLSENVFEVYSKISRQKFSTLILVKTREGREFTLCDPSVLYLPRSL